MSLIIAVALANAGMITERRARQVVQGDQDSENYSLARQAFARYGKTKRREDYMEYIRLRDSLPQRFRILFVELQRPVRKEPV